MIKKKRGIRDACTELLTPISSAPGAARCRSGLRREEAEISGYVKK